MAEKYGWFNDYYSSNALKMGKIRLVSLNLQLFFEKGYVGTKPDEFQRLKEELLDMIPKNPNEYDTCLTQQKVELAKEIKNKVYVLLTFLSEQSPASSPF